ncbi:methyl-accepting chemotaxis protein [Herbaspirillum sp. NPDC101396]|uniref:methyl-accepting chemotaxis protein n=1 Tax=Herbaspirillum sp. NPDC101396 TaxID=3364005 RepID=UPI00383A919C
MAWFYNLRISRKLLISFCIILSLTCSLGAFSVLQLAKVNQASVEIATNWLPSISVALDLKVALSRVRAIQLQHILSSKEQEFVQNEKELEQQNRVIRQKIIDFGPLANTDVEKAIIAKLAREFNEILSVQKKVLAISRLNKTAEAHALHMAEFTPLYFRILGDADTLASVNLSGSKEADEVAHDTFQSSRILILSLLLASTCLGIAMAIWVSRLVVKPLQQAVMVAQRVADGDLTTSINPVSKDETGQLMLALKAMTDSLSKIVNEVRLGTDCIATASTQIATGNLDLSSRTEQQASSLQETSSSVNDLTIAVKQNADSANHANQLAVSAAKIATEGGEVVTQVVETMQSINTSSKKISDIIGVIDGIAFQTNILALNAAVEAARAGEQGRGFAVVASEVRSLAQRSASAAKDIKSLIDDSVTKVDTGSKLVEHAGATMRNIVSSVKRVTDIVGEISSSSQTQSTRIEQVNQSILQMDEVTQQNAALVEQAAAAAQSLQDQAAKLAQVVGVFRLNMADTSASTTTQTSQAPRLAIMRRERLPMV